MLVLDASVIIKWLLADPVRESDTESATALVVATGNGRYDIVMPPHWLAEVSAVLCRLSPRTAVGDVETLLLLEWPVVGDPAIYRRAAGLSLRLRHHLFDTLYHAVALERGATLVTADRAYWRKAAGQGRITLLEDFSAG